MDAANGGWAQTLGGVQTIEGCVQFVDEKCCARLRGVITLLLQVFFSGSVNRKFRWPSI
jgi:hypothetical protein